MSSLGDILLSSPLIRSLKKQFPHIEIDYCLRREYADTVKYSPFLSKQFLYEKSDTVIQQIQSAISDNRYDLIIDLQNNIRSRFLLKGNKTRIVRFHKLVWAKFLLVKLKMNFMHRSLQIPERYARTLSNFKLDGDGLDIFIPDSVSASLPANQNYIGFCPGSRHYTKMWPYDYYTELGEQLALNGYKILLFGGRSDKHLCEVISKGIPNSINLCSDNDLLQTARNMSLCRTIISNDTGLMHLAAAMKVPTLAIFGSSVREFGFTPYRNQHIIIENPLAKCRPCSHYGKEQCPKSHFECMLRITPAMVFQNLIRFSSSK